MDSWNIMDFGAAGDGLTDDAAAIQRAVDACAASGGGRVLIPAGRTVLAGSFELKSRVDFHVEAGATLLSATDIDAFPRHVFSHGEEAEKRLWIGAKDAEDITLSGLGTIDGQCRAFALGESEFIFSPTLRWRPAMTCLENIRRVAVRDLTFRNAANWTLHFSGCEDVSVKDVRIFNDLRFPNADGIDPDHCRRVRISGCHIISADDCIVLKNTASFLHYGPCEDIEITDCRLESASAAFKIGSESHCDFRRIRVSDCVIERSNRGLAIQLRDGGNIEDVEFRNIRIATKRFAPMWWGAGEAIYVTALPRNGETAGGTVRDIRFRDVHCEGENGAVVYGDPSGRINGLSFERVHVGIRRQTAWPSGLLDLRPFQGGYCPRNAEPAGEVTPWGYPVSRTPSAFAIDGAPDTAFEGVTYSLPDNDEAGWEAVQADPPLARPGDIRPKGRKHLRPMMSPPERDDADAPVVMAVKRGGIPAITLGRTGLMVSRLAFGGASLAGADNALADRLIGSAIDAGITLFDAAQCYGRAEEHLGRTLRGRREQVVLVTKCGHHEVLPDGRLRSRKISSADIDAGLRRLGVDHIDVMLLHSYDRDLLLDGEAIGVLSAARRAGKVRFLGYSGDNESAALTASVPGMDVLEMSVSIADQANLRVALPAARAANLGVLAKRCLANAAWRHLGSPAEQWSALHEAEYVRRLLAMGCERSGPPEGGDWDALALRFALSVPGVHAAIAGSSREQNILRNSSLAAGAPLEPEQVQLWQERFRQAEQHSGVPWPASN